MNKLLLTITLIASLLSVSCAKEAQQADPIINNPTVVQPVNPDGEILDPEIPTGSGFGSGGFAQLDSDTQTFETFFTRSTNNVSNIKLNLDLRENSNGTFSGTASIYFTDRGQTKYLEFRTGGEAHSGYNVWINHDKQFHAVFDDGDKGMIVVTIDRVYDLGDGLGAEDLVEGSVFYYNYDLRSKNGYAPNKHPQFYGEDSYCWEITASPSPYNCKPWSSLSQANSQLWPDSHVNVLGRFTEMSLNKAFNLSTTRR